MNCSGNPSFHSLWPIRAFYFFMWEDFEFFASSATEARRAFTLHSFYRLFPNCRVFQCHL